MKPELKLYVNDEKELAASLEKLARTVRLSEDPREWPSEVLQQFHRQVPFADEYDVTVDLSDIDHENLTGMGRVILSAKITRPMKDTETKYNKDVRLDNKRVHIPVIVRQGELFPMDVFLANRKVYPLSKRRVRRALFRPNTMDVITGGYGDIGLSRELSVPNRFQAYPWGASGMGKLSEAPLADAVLETVDPRHWLDWGVKLSSNEHLKNAALDNEYVSAFFQKLEKKEASSDGHEKTASLGQLDVLQSMEPDAIQFYHVEDGNYVLRKVARRYWDPVAQKMGRKEALAVVGPEMVKAADMDGPQTMTTTEVSKPVSESDMIPVVKDGLYKVKSTDGKILVGWVYTNVYGMDGEPRPYKIFTDLKGEYSAVQAEIWGELLTSEDAMDSTPDRRDEPEGYGVFTGSYDRDGDGLRIYGPCTIAGKLITPEGLEYKAELFGGGEQVSLVRTDIYVRAPSETLDGRYVLPRHMGWIGLGQTIALAENPMEAAKTASFEEAHREVQLITDGNMFTFKGPAVEKLAVEHRTDLGLEDAQLMAAAMGWSQEAFSEKVAEASACHQAVTLPLCLPLTPARELFVASKKQAEANWKKIKHLQKDLLKEASFIKDPASVDAMLSLKFLTPYNVALFAKYKGTLDNAAQKLSELLVAVRLGLPDIPEDAVLAGIRGVEDTLEGLERLEQVGA